MSVLVSRRPYCGVARHTGWRLCDQEHKHATMFGPCLSARIPTYTTHTLAFPLQILLRSTSNGHGIRDGNFWLHHMSYRIMYMATMVTHCALQHKSAVPIPVTLTSIAQAT